MTANRDVNVQQEWAGRSGNDYLQRGGQGYQSWGAEGPSGTVASGGPPAAPEATAPADAAGSPAPTHRTGGSPFFSLLTGVGLGAALMYFLDPERGTGRRHRVADQAASAARRAEGRLRDLAAHARNRGTGAVAEVRGRLTEDEVSDEQLVARVRAELGHHVESVRPIEVVADHGNVTLRGDVPAEELPAVIQAVEKVRGVRWVDNRLATRLDGPSDAPVDL